MWCKSTCTTCNNTTFLLYFFKVAHSNLHDQLFHNLILKNIPLIPVPFKFSLQLSKQLLAIFLLSVFIYSCKKNDLQTKEKQTEVVTPKDELQKKLASDFFVQNRKVADMAEERNNGLSTGSQLTVDNGPSDPEYTDEVPMVLGIQLPNPYSIPNMVETYNTYYAANLTTVPITHYYVRFSPSNESQLTLLEDSLEVEIFDYPMNYEVVQDGDYYQQPGKGVEDMPDFFAVVPNNFQFPSGVPYVILEDLHFPHDDPILEALAESIAAGGNYNSYRINNSDPDIMMTRIENNSQMLNQNNCECFPNPEDLACIPPDPDCYIPPNPEPPGGWQPPTPGPAPANTPSGYIRYQDNVANIDRPLRGVEVIAKRGRKTAKAYTDNNGFFVMGRNFPGPVKIIIKYRTQSTINVKPLRLQNRIRLSLLTVRQRVDGTFGINAMNQLNIRVTTNGNINSKSHSYWLASHAVFARYHQEIIASTLQEVKHFSSHRFVIYLQRWGDELGRHPRAELIMENYLFKNRNLFDWGAEVAKVIMYAAKKKWGSALFTIVSNVLGSQRPDIMYNYNTPFSNQGSNIVHQQFFSQFNQCGVLKATNDHIKWKSYFKARVKEIDLGIGLVSYVPVSMFNQYLYEGVFPSSPDAPGWPSYAAMAISMIQYVYHTLSAPEESFFEMTKGYGEYYAHTMCNTLYLGTNNSFKNQFGIWINSNGSLTSHKIYLDTWIPDLAIDYYKLDRIGLFEDLNNPVGGFVPRTNILDQVANTKNKDMFNSIAAPLSLPPYSVTESWIDFREKVRFNNNPFSNQIVTLFQAYQIQ